MVLRSATWLAAAFALVCTWFAVDCARMCIMGGGSMHMPCWLAQHSGLTCDTGMLIMLILFAMLGAFATIMLWMREVASG